MDTAYSSIDGADAHTSFAHVDSKGRIEAHIRALGLPATVLRPVFFMDNFASLTRPVPDGGELLVSLAIRPETRLRMVSTRDVGAFAAIAFDQPEQFLGQQVEIAGDDLTGVEIAEVFERACVVPARFRQVPIQQLRAFDGEVAKMFEWMDRRATDGPDLAARGHSTLA